MAGRSCHRRSPRRHNVLFRRARSSTEGEPGPPTRKTLANTLTPTLSRREREAAPAARRVRGRGGWGSVAWEVVPGYADRILAINERAAKELKKRTLTNLYNLRPAWLDNIHSELDEAVVG
jgi:hypothetical protein